MDASGVDEWSSYDRGSHNNELRQRCLSPCSLEPQLKRGPGCPRKVPRSPVLPEQKRGRGCPMKLLRSRVAREATASPRKVPVETPVKREDNVESPNSRGRPRKYTFHSFVGMRRIVTLGKQNVSGSEDAREGTVPKRVPFELLKVNS
ncbi:unnamed protein product [Calypogeia fissa]